MTTITDIWGRVIAITDDTGQTIYAVTDPVSGATSTFVFPASVDQTTAVASIEAAMPTSQSLSPVTIVPQSISRYQAMAVLSLTPSPVNPGKTLLDDVTAAVTAQGGLAALAWANATTFDRNGTFITQLAPALGLASAALDQLFITAAGIAG